jgi:hypothetical protein
MLEKFVQMLRERLSKERAAKLLENGRSHGIPLERREALVERVRTLEWVLEQMKEILKLREDEVDDDDATGVENDDAEQPPRRRPQARNWGG